MELKIVEKIDLKIITELSKCQRILDIVNLECFTDILLTFENSCGKLMFYRLKTHGKSNDEDLELFLANKQIADINIYDKNKYIKIRVNPEKKECYIQLENN